MKSHKTMILITALLMITATAYAEDFGWVRDFNIQAQADPSGLKARLATRFHIGGMEIDAVIGSVDNPADAYTCLRLGEIANQPVNQVVERYRAAKGKGWGALARSLGIDPGSKAFQDLKRGQDLYQGTSKDKGSGKGNGKGKKRK